MPRLPKQDSSGVERRFFRRDTSLTGAGRHALLESQSLFTPGPGNDDGVLRISSGFPPPRGARFTPRRRRSRAQTRPRRSPPVSSRPCLLHNQLPPITSRLYDRVTSSPARAPPPLAAAPGELASQTVHTIYQSVESIMIPIRQAIRRRYSWRHAPDSGATYALGDARARNDSLRQAVSYAAADRSFENAKRYRWWSRNHSDDSQREAEEDSRLPMGPRATRTWPCPSARPQFGPRHRESSTTLRASPESHPRYRQECVDRSRFQEI